MEVFSKLEEVSCMVFSEDGKMLCVGFDRGSIGVWEWPGMKEKVRCRCVCAQLRRHRNKEEREHGR